MKLFKLSQKYNLPLHLGSGSIRFSQKYPPRELCGNRINTGYIHFHFCKHYVHCKFLHILRLLESGRHLRRAQPIQNVGLWFRQLLHIYRCGVQHCHSKQQAARLYLQTLYLVVRNNALIYSCSILKYTI